MVIYQLAIYDSNAGHVEIGYYKTKSLAAKAKKQLEKQYNRKFEANEFGYRPITVKE